jgi:peptidoglycan hydrolase-like amidase
MVRRPLFTSAVLAGVLLQLVPALPAFAVQRPFVEQSFTAAPDAFSVKLPESGGPVEYQYEENGVWSEWQAFESDGDEQPGDTESELVMLPYGVSAIRVAGIGSGDDLHPITVSRDPVRVRTAYLAAALPRTAVLSRAEWGADESYLFFSPPATSAASEADTAKGDNGGGSGTVNQRVKDCQQAQSQYPGEFKTASTVTKDAAGRSYLWPLQYSKEVKLLVVHHTALGVKNDPRPAAERVRALYKYHAVSKAWGDLGYHFVIDENGQVYEGKAGGKYVVGGHAYCNNVGTLGIVLMGNFETEQPSQAQAKALQRLLLDLAAEYKIDVASSTQFHGKTFDSPVVRHKDLLSTLCPGYYLSEAFGQVVKNVRNRTPDAAVTFPKLPSSSGASSSRPPTSALGLQEGIAFTGRTTISINPGGKQRLSFTYTAGPDGAYESKKIADVSLLSRQIQLFVDDGIRWVPVTKGILLPTDLPAYETVSVQLVVQAPMDPGTYLMDIAGIRFTMAVSGRRARGGEYTSPFYVNPASIVLPSQVSSSRSVAARVRPQSRLSLQSSASAPLSSAASSVRTVTPSGTSPEIRIKLSASQNPVLRFGAAGTVGGTPVRAGSEFSLVKKAGVCEAQSRGESITAGTMLRFFSSLPLTVDGVSGKTRSYRGVIECRIINGSLVLINELPLEDYLRGLAEEPDSEPYEKQRAFAIAARTYAAYYLVSDQRKFPGMPYDGSDSPAEFQAYAGVDFEAANPRWVKAVESTSEAVLRYQGALFKPAYFSSDDGRTRAPSEAGWKNFPAAEIFMSKPDPWCSGMTLRGHGVGMSGCGAEGQAQEGKTGEQILQYYYPGSVIAPL